MRHIKEKPYYLAYEERYKRVYKAGVESWGHTSYDEELISILTAWVEKNKLYGKRIIEFACGEGAAGVILSKLGCIYHGVDIALSALKKAEVVLRNYPNASVSLLDMVNRHAEEKYDAALDIMGFHMLVTDFDRANYLKNAYACLKNGTPMLFFRELYENDAYDGSIESFEKWKAVCGGDYETPKRVIVKNDVKDVEVYIPLVPARAKTEEGYRLELTDAGFIIDDFQEMEYSYKIASSASIYVHKP